MHKNLIYGQSIINSSVNDVDLKEIKQNKFTPLVIGGSSGYGKSIFNFQNQSSSNVLL